MVRMVDSVYETDVLVIGGGGAAARAAIEADEFDANVIMTVKGLLGRSCCTSMAETTCNAAFGFADPEDSTEKHFEDTVIGGGYVNNQILVDIFTKEAMARVLDLERYGAIFDRSPDGKFDQRMMGGHRHKRGVYHGDRTGHEMMQALMDEVNKRKIEVLQDVMVTSLLTRGNTVIGATGLNRSNGAFMVFRANSTILATGGAGQLYIRTTNPLEKTGDGFAVAYDAGAELVDMEFVQIHPTGLQYPNTGYLVPEGLRGYGARLINAKGERYMSRYDPRLELTTRDVCARANFNEVREGRGTEHGAVYLDCTVVPRETIEIGFSDLSQYLLRFGIDMQKQPLEVFPIAHHFMGGVKINEKCETNVPGLFAAGEVAGGVHGGNRLGGNALAEIQVFGARAGRYAAERSKSSNLIPVDHVQVEKEHERIFSILKQRDGPNPIEVKRRIQQTMWDNVGVFRTEQSLSRALSDLQRIRVKDLPNLHSSVSATSYNYEWTEAIEIQNMLDVAEMVTRAALMRNESRCAHYREDHPKTDNGRWLSNIMIRKEASLMVLTKNPAVITKLRPK
jgi:fumarate reductase (CoM/CoB) subunit A